MTAYTSTVNQPLRATQVRGDTATHAHAHSKDSPPPNKKKHHFPNERLRQKLTLRMVELDSGGGGGRSICRGPWSEPEAVPFCLGDS